MRRAPGGHYDRASWELPIVADELVKTYGKKVRALDGGIGVLFGVLCTRRYRRLGR